MITKVYTRHKATCPKREDRYWARCRCPKWIWITDKNGSRRMSAKTRSWEKAEASARRIDAGEPDPVLGSQRTTIAHAIDLYLADKRTQNLASGTICKLDCFFGKQMRQWMRGSGLAYLDEIQLAHLEKFRSSWPDQPLSRSKKQERLSSFFGYCLRHKWIPENPVHALSRIKVSVVPTLYFDRDEFSRIVNTIPFMYQDHRMPRETRDGLRAQLLAMVLLLRCSGLRIRDAVTLSRDRLADDGKLRLYMAKTGEYVFVVLPPQAADALRALINSNPRYFFWTGNGLPKTAVANWQRTLRRLFRKVNLGKRCHPHMFRDTFAVEYLLGGIPLDQVSILLGHASVKVTEKHYAPFVKARQEQLEVSMRAAWERMPGGELLGSAKNVVQ